MSYLLAQVPELLQVPGLLDYHVLEQVQFPVQHRRLRMRLRVIHELWLLKIRVPSCDHVVHEGDPLCGALHLRLPTNDSVP